MSVDGLQTCPHCRALVQSSICSICGRSALEEVAAPASATRPRWSESFEHHELRKVATGLLLVVVLAAGTAFVLTRPDSAPSANALPPPVSTTSVEPPTTSAPPPSLVGGTRPATGFLPGVPREVDEAPSPWDSSPPVDVVTGRLLDESIDYTADIVRVAELLDAFPGALTLAPLDPPDILTFEGRLDAEQLESTQPFAARTLHRGDGSVVGELWLIASGGSEVGDAYLAAARARWNLDAAVDQFTPEAGLRLWLLGADATTNLWAGDLDDDSMILLQSPVTVDPTTLTDVLKAWRGTAV